MDHARLRPLEALAVPGGTGICLRDPAGYCAEPVVLSPASLLLLPYLDGAHTVRDIQLALTRRTGQIVFTQVIEGLIRQLDELHLLEGENFERHRREVEAGYRALPTRPAAHAGISYPAEAARLAAELDSFFTDPRGPGLPAMGLPAGPSPAGDRSARDSSAGRLARPATGSLRAIVAPHIDLRSGGPCYAHAWRALVEECPATTFVILGVAHAGARQLFTATRKGFDTPLGLVPLDTDFLDRLAAHLPFDLYADEFAHRSEHSVEFQALFLRRLFGEEARMVPILVGGLHPFLEAGRLPEEDERVAAFIAETGALLGEWGERAAVVVSVDLAHVGPRFGDAEPLRRGFLERVEQADRVFLEAAAARDAAALYQTIARDHDARRVDGFPGIYTLLRALPLRAGRMLRYEQAVDAAAGSAVSFASLAFYA